MKISIVVPYTGSQLLTERWAVEEKDIDFQKDAFSACRCTVSFAATELKKHLQILLKEADILYSDAEIKEGCFNIILSVEDEASRDSGYTITPVSNGIIITGKGRTGLLHGAYGYLRYQGWRWYFPEKRMQMHPETIEKLKDLEMPIVMNPKFEEGRGFDFEFSSLESGDLFIWMARNGMTMATHRGNTAKLCDKLGMKIAVGGHIFEDILDPDRVMEDGRTIWEAKREWYGYRSEVELQKDEALRIQFCVSKPDLIELLGKELVKIIRRDWASVDRINIWGFDTWGPTCMCKDCCKLGNGTDKNIVFLNEMRKALNKAAQRGEIRKGITLSISGYEGTATIEPPNNPIPREIIEAGDSVVYYPINRCYEHNINDSSCYKNKMYNENLLGWVASGIKVYIGEYYNVSKYEDLPLMFTGSIINDYEYYNSIDVVGTTYMHIPIVDWGIRTLTENLYAYMTYSGKEPQLFCDDYFVSIYGKYADKAKEAYSFAENATRNIAQLRSWDNNSMLSRMFAWDGTVPTEALFEEKHFSAHNGAYETAMEAKENLEKAYNILNEIRIIQRKDYTEQFVSGAHVYVNPHEANRAKTSNILGKHLATSCRGLKYGVQCNELMALNLKVYSLLLAGENGEARSLFAEIEALEQSMELMGVPGSFEQPYAGILVKNAVERSQMDAFIVKLRKLVRQI